MVIGETSKRQLSTRGPFLKAAWHNKSFLHYVDHAAGSLAEVNGRRWILKQPLKITPRDSSKPPCRLLQNKSSTIWLSAQARQDVDGTIAVHEPTDMVTIRPSHTSSRQTVFCIDE